jgi:predicted phage terminase large subunit-like protein
MIDHINNAEWDKMRQNRAVRQAICSQSFYWFFHLYFGHYIEYPTADFQRELMELASQPSIEHLVVMAFRESGKSTIITTAFPLWAVMGNLQKKYVVIVSQTQNQAQQHLKNVAAELESNNLISKDFMPYDYEDNELGVSAINLPKFGARIIAVSREQGVRGLRHGPHRPDLIISDDVEDSNSVKTSEGRKKTYDWFTGELLPLGTEKTKFITVGNLLHEASLLMRLKAGFESGQRNGRFLEYPLVNDGKPLWLSRFPNEAAIERLEKRIANPIIWQREYMLHLVPDDDQIVTPEMIQYYQQIPQALVGQSHKIVIGVDLAISEKDSADCTAMVILDIIGDDDKQQIYVHPQPFNKHVTFPETIERIHDLNAIYHYPTFYVETTAYQEALLQSLKQHTIDVTGVKPQSDKRTRLNMIAHKIKSGSILFPEHGCEALIAQLVGFGIEKHDDLVDALTMAVLENARDERTTGRMWVGRHHLFDSRQTLTGRGTPGKISGFSIELGSDGNWHRR